MKQKGATGLLIAATLAVILVFHVFEQETLSVGKYTVLYYKNRCSIDFKSFPGDLNSLKSLPCLIRITWREQIASNMFQEYCYLPGREVGKTRLIQTTK